MAPPISAELRAVRDREFAERLHRRLAEKNGAAGDKVEPIFKTTNAKPSAVPPAQRPLDAAATRHATNPQPAPSPQPASTPLARKLPDLKIDEPARASEPARTPRADATVPNRPTSPAQALPSLPLIMRAAQFAAERHKTQRRRGAAREPYVNHLIEVAALLATATDGRDPDLVIAGLLHDLIEDQGVSADDISRQFGVGVAALVLEMTTDKTLPEAERGRVQVAHAAHKSPRARMLRIADLTSNLRALRQSPPADWSAERQREYFGWAKEVVAGSRGVSPPLDAAFDEAYGAGPPVHDVEAQPAAR